LRHFDMHHYDFQELHFPITAPDFHANTKESLHRPDIIRYRKRITERYMKPESARILVLLPCSAKKPYSLSKTHTLYRKAIKDSGCQHLVHEVIITSPLGIVPRELELFYPAQNYDIPVTGHWSRDEIAMIQEDLIDLLDKNEYDHIIAHLGTEKDFVREVLEDHTSTSDGSPTSKASLSKLTEELSGIAETYPKGQKSNRMLEDMTGRCVFQFGKGGEALTRSAETKGRYPSLKIFSEGKQLGMMVEERGMLSLTLDGAERISEAAAYCVQIDDFHPEGNLFAIGVEDADKEIRIGDDVAIRHGKDVRAVGTAVMNWKEMVESERGEAVRIRHRRKV
jgi:archaeosine synthase